MNLVLETFERVFYPNGGTANRRASVLGFSAHNHQQHSSAAEVADSFQIANVGGRRRSGDDPNISSQFSRQGSPMPMASAAVNCVTLFNPLLKEYTTKRERKRSDLKGAGAAERGGGAEAEMIGGDRTPSRSGSAGIRRKKSATGGSHPRKQSMVSLLLAAISSSAPSAQNRRRNRLPPPRQLSVPERGSLDPNSEDDEPFRLVQKVPSVSLSSSSSYNNQRTPPTERLSRECFLDSQTEGIASNNCHSQLILFGFAVGQQSSSLKSDRRFSNRSLPLSESFFLAQLGQLRQSSSLSRALLLRSVDPEPLYPFLHYAIFDSCETKAEEMAHEMSRMSTGQVDFISFEEVIALERQADDAFNASPLLVRPSRSLSAHANPLGSSVYSGFIVLCFRLLDGQTDSNSQLENTWLSWTGANEIYKYSPRSWQLRRLSLLRRVPFSAVRSFPSLCPSSPFTFAYVLLCEFGSILHPNNALAALDMCERLRTRNCGTVSLYQIRHRFAVPSNAPAFSSSSSSSHNGHFPSPTMSNSLSPHWSPQQIRRNGAGYRLARMGFSQDVPDRVSEITQRRTMLLRMRERSLGWDGGGMGGTAL